VARLKALGEEGVTALICDSTNAIRDGMSPSEADVAVILERLIAEAPRRGGGDHLRLNVARVRSVANGARAASRKLVVVGRAMYRVIEAAQETGYLDPDLPFHEETEFENIPARKVVALCTGSQGEARAAMARIALDEHPNVSLDAGDRVIFSSRTIPGNEKAVGRVQNGLADLGVEVITDGDAPVHVSGHPRRGELEQLYRWLRPQLAIPMHGEGKHLEAHARLAERLGVPEVIRARNGAMVRLAPAPAAIVDDVPVGRLYRDGAIITRAEDGQVRERRKLSFAGSVSVSLVLSDKGMLVADPEVALSGIPATDGQGTSFKDHCARSCHRHHREYPAAAAQGSGARQRSCTRGVRARRQPGLGQEDGVHGAADGDLVKWKTRPTRPLARPPSPPGRDGALAQQRFPIPSRFAGRVGAAPSRRRGGLRTRSVERGSALKGSYEMIGRLNHVAIAVPDLAAATKV
jgi:ribonuclease J